MKFSVKLFQSGMSQRKLGKCCVVKFDKKLTRDKIIQVDLSASNTFLLKLKIEYVLFPLKNGGCYRYIYL
jgi:hypothetical protein